MEQRDFKSLAWIGVPSGSTSDAGRSMAAGTSNLTRDWRLRRSVNERRAGMNAHEQRGRKRTKRERTSNEPRTNRECAPDATAESFKSSRSGPKSWVVVSGREYSRQQESAIPPCPPSPSTVLRWTKVVGNRPPRSCAAEGPTSLWRALPTSRRAPREIQSSPTVPPSRGSHVPQAGTILRAHSAPPL